MEPGEEYRRWLDFTFRATADRLLIQDRPTSTTALTREQAEALIAHVRRIADGLPTLADRLDGLGRCAECCGNGRMARYGMGDEACRACGGSGMMPMDDTARLI